MSSTDVSSGGALTDISVSQESFGATATITMDDGKVNAISFAMLEALHGALDAADAASAKVVVLRGRDGILSAGFDLKVMKAGGPDVIKLVNGGMDLAARLLASPVPVVLAVTGHAVAMGALLLGAADYRIGIDGAFWVQTNETRIGMTMPHAGIVLLKDRLTGPGMNRAVLLGEPLAPMDALRSGFFDQVASPDDFDAAVNTVVQSLGEVDTGAYYLTKMRYRADLLAALDVAQAKDLAENS